MKNYSDIKLFLSDVDGVLTDGGMYYTESGDEFKKFNAYDGMGFKLMQADGLKVGIITAEDRNLNRKRAQKLGMDFEFHGIKNKLDVLNELLKKLNLYYKNVAYVGDDINDLEVLKNVGSAFCPSTAQPEVLAIKNIHVLKSSGGSGVIREIHRLFQVS